MKSLTIYTPAAVSFQNEKNSLVYTSLKFVTLWTQKKKNKKNNNVLHKDSCWSGYEHDNFPVSPCLHYLIVLLQQLQGKVRYRMGLKTQGQGDNIERMSDELNCGDVQLQAWQYYTSNFGRRHYCSPV